MKISKQIALFLLVVIMYGCGTPMKQVMQDCDQGQDFVQYSYCIRGKYDSEGRHPNSSAVRAFYANLDAITESYNKKQISNAQAKAMTYNAFMNTIQADNDRKRSVSCYTDPTTRITNCF
jgi:hypothetical protein